MTIFEQYAHISGRSDAPNNFPNRRSANKPMPEGPSALLETGRPMEESVLMV